MSECLSELERQLVETRAEMDALREQLDGTEDPAERRRLRTALLEAEERMVILRHQNRKGPAKTRAKRTATYGGRRGRSGGELDSAGQVERWMERELYDEPEGPTQRDRQLGAIQAGLTGSVTQRQREMLLMYANGLSMVQIGEILGVDKSTVSRTVGRAVKNLKRVSNTIQAAHAYAESRTAAPLIQMMAGVEIFTEKERKAMMAAAARTSLGDIALILGMDMDEAKEILDTARAKLRGAAHRPRANMKQHLSWTDTKGEEGHIANADHY